MQVTVTVKIVADKKDKTLACISALCCAINAWYKDKRKLHVPGRKTTPWDVS